MEDQLRDGSSDEKGRDWRAANEVISSRPDYVRAQVIGGSWRLK